MKYILSDEIKFKKIYDKCKLEELYKLHEIFIRRIINLLEKIRLDKICSEIYYKAKELEGIQESENIEEIIRKFNNFIIEYNKLKIEIDKEKDVVDQLKDQSKISVDKANNHVDTVNIYVESLQKLGDLLGKEINRIYQDVNNISEEIDKIHDSKEKDKNISIHRIKRLKGKFKL